MPKKKVKRSTVTKKAGSRKAKRAGRPKGSGKYGCETKAVRIPVYLEDDVKSYVLRKVKSGK